MTAARRRHDDPRTAAALALIGTAACSGVELAELLRLSPSELAYVTQPLWDAKLLQGEVSDGCCRDPCGATCVSCRIDLRWSLTRKGATTLRRDRARASALPPILPAPRPAPR